MANGILKNLNQSLEITLRDNLDGLKEFSLMMASTSIRPQFKVLPAEQEPYAKANPQHASTPLTLLDTEITTEPEMVYAQKKKRA